MLYLDKSSDTFRLAVPLGGEAVYPKPPVTFKARNTSDLSAVDFSITGLETVGAFVYVSGPVPAGLFPGEWRYELRQGTFKFSDGLLIVTQSDPAGAQYDRQIQYKQYGTEE